MGRSGFNTPKMLANSLLADGCPEPTAATRNISKSLQGVEVRRSLRVRNMADNTNPRVVSAYFAKELVSTKGRRRKSGARQSVVTSKKKNVRDAEEHTIISQSLVVDEYKRLGSEFYQCDALDLAPRLLGKLLRRDEVVLQITEVEAYRPEDTACHGRFGQTARTEAMFRAGGHAYVYLCYGTNVMLNVVADRLGVGAAVLIRACSPVAGLEIIQSRRKDAPLKPALLAGPGKVGQALGLTTDWSSHPLYTPGGLEILDGPPPEGLLAGPRVGINYAAPHDVAAPWRFAIAGTPWVSAPRTTLAAVQLP